MANMSYASALKKDMPAVKKSKQKVLTARQVETAGQRETAPQIESPRQEGTVRQVEIAEEVETVTHVEIETPASEAAKEDEMFIMVEATNTHLEIGKEVDVLTETEAVAVEAVTQVETSTKVETKASQARSGLRKWIDIPTTPRIQNKTICFGPWKWRVPVPTKRIKKGDDAHRPGSLSLPVRLHDDGRSIVERTYRSKRAHLRGISDIIEETYREKWPGRYAEHYDNDVLKVLRKSAVSRTSKFLRKEWVEWLCDFW